MAWYRVDDILNKELPDAILIDMAFRLYANDNFQLGIRLPGLPYQPLPVPAYEIEQ